LFDPKTGDHYHSLKGAKIESLHVYVSAGFEYAASLGRQRLSLLEVGLGTGLNAYCTFLQNQELKLDLEYSALEPFPLDLELLEELVPPKISQRDLWLNLINTQAGSTKRIDQYSMFKWYRQTLADFQTDQQFDLIYYDAFAPRFQAEMWDEPSIQKLSTLIRKGGSIVTYCAQGQFRRLLKDQGFSVEKLPGPDGKWEMTRATKIG